MRPMHVKNTNRNVRDMYVVNFSHADEITKSQYPARSWELDKIPWVPFGSDNLFPEKFMDMLSQSGIYNRVMSSLAAAIQGEGLAFDTDGSEYVKQELERAGVNYFFLEKCAWDLAVLNSLSFNLYINKLSKLQVEHIPARLVRVGKSGCDYYVARDWSVIDYAGRVNPLLGINDIDYYLPERYAGLNENTGSALVYDFRYTPAMTCYPLPQSEPALKSIQALDDIINFQASIATNSINSSMIIKIPRKPSANEQLENEARRRIVDEIQRDLAGAKNAGKALVVFYDNLAGGNTVEIESAPNSDLDTKFVETIRVVNENIMTSLGVISPELFGIPSAGGFSSQSELLITAYKLFLNTTVAPLQKILTRWIEYILNRIGITGVRVTINNSVPVPSDISLDDVSAGVLSVDEYRRMKFGLDPLPKQESNALITNYQKNLNRWHAANAT